MEVYVNDMLVKIGNSSRHIEHLVDMFEILRSYHIKLNPLKCAFSVSSGKVLSFIVSSRGIEANPKKIKALIEMESPKKPKEV